MVLYNNGIIFKIAKVKSLSWTIVRPCTTITPTRQRIVIDLYVSRMCSITEQREVRFEVDQTVPRNRSRERTVDVCYAVCADICVPPAGETVFNLNSFRLGRSTAVWKFVYWVPSNENKNYWFVRRARIQYYTVRYKPIRCIRCDMRSDSSGAKRYDAMRYDTVRYDTTRYDTIRHDTIRYDTIVLS